MEKSLQVELGDRALALLSTRKDAISRALTFQCCPKALDYRIIVAIPFFTHTYLDVMLTQQALIPAAGIFTAPV
ncbi:hypothetical protein ccbrp13_63350 [Ktedonobacteria bacterium brp13]|nr:hypothetical protein ccbrp13_63350 [Ktedonobacteria bacterium brp13]